MRNNTRALLLSCAPDGIRGRPRAGKVAEARTSRRCTGQSVLRARRSMRVTVTTSPGARVSSILRSWRRVAVRARHLVAVNLDTARAAQLPKLVVERLAAGADAGMTKTTILR